MNEPNVRQQAEELLSGLSEELKDAVYRSVWFDHVCEDIEGYEPDLDLEMALTKDQICYAAKRYVYDGEYDCNLSYWQNIENLIHLAQECA